MKFSLSATATTIKKKEASENLFGGVTQFVITHEQEQQKSRVHEHLESKLTPPSAVAKQPAPAPKQEAPKPAPAPAAPVQPKASEPQKVPEQLPQNINSKFQLATKETSGFKLSSAPKIELKSETAPQTVQKEEEPVVELPSQSEMGQSITEEPRRYDRSVIAAIQSQASSRDDKVLTVATDEYRLRREEHIQATIERISNKKKPLTLAETGRTIHTKSSIKDNIFMPADLLQFYRNNRQLCQQEPACIDTQQMIDFYMYVYGDRTPQLIDLTDKNSSYRFVLPPLKEEPKGNFVSGDFASEIARMHIDEAFYKQCSPYMHRLESSVLEACNKLSDSNLEKIRDEINIAMTKTMGAEPLCQIPKMTTFLVIDSIFSKACIEPKFQQQYCTLLHAITCTETFSSNIFRSSYDQGVFDEKIKTLKAKLLNIPDLKRQYCQNIVRKLLATIMDEHIETGHPRSRLYEIPNAMPADQKIYKQELRELYMAGFARFCSILFINKYITVDKMIHYARALMRFNAYLQLEKSSNMAALFAAHENTNFDKASILREKFDVSVFKQQITLLNQLLPDLHWFPAAEICQSNPALKTDSPSQLAQKFADEVLSEKELARYIDAKDEELTTFFQKPEVSPIPKMTKLAVECYRLRELLYVEFKEFIEPFYEVLSARQQFEIDELNFKRQKGFQTSQSPYLKTVQKWVASKLTKEVEKPRPTEKQKLSMVTADQMVRIYREFLEADVQVAVCTVCATESVELTKNFFTSLARVSVPYVVEHASSMRLVQQFLQQLAKYLEANGQSATLREVFTSGTQYHKLFALPRCVELFEHLIKTGILNLPSFAESQAIVETPKQIFPAVFKRLIGGSQDGDDEDEDAYPVDKLFNYVERAQIPKLIADILAISKTEPTAAAVYNMLESYDIRELFQAYVQFSIVDPQTMDTFLSEPEAAKYLRDSSVQKHLLSVVLRTCDNQDLTQKFLAIQRPSTATVADTVASCYANACNDNDALSKMLDFLVFSGTVEKPALAEFATKQSFGPMVQLKQNPVFQAWMAK